MVRRDAYQRNEAPQRATRPQKTQAKRASKPKSAQKRPRTAAKPAADSQSAPKKRTRNAAPAAKRGPKKGAVAYNSPKAWTENGKKPIQAAPNRKQEARRRRRGHPAFLDNGRFRLIAAIVICLVLVTGVDYFIHRGTIFNGITVGKVDVGGMTIEEAAKSISEAYSPQIDDKTIGIFAGEALDGLSTENPTPEQLFELADQMEDFDEGDQAASTLHEWKTNATELDASIAAQGLAQEAFDKGRGDGFVFKRLFAAIAGISIEPRMTISEKGAEALAETIDWAIGSPHVDSGIVIDEGVASVVPGSDGREIDRNAFMKVLETSFLDETTDSPVFTVKAQDTPQRINQEMAQAVCDRVNASIANGCIFYYYGVGWEVKPALLGSWVNTSILQIGGKWQLVPFIEADWARSAVLAQTKTWGDQTPVRISFSKDNGKLEVITDGSFKIPQVDDAISQLTSALFESSSAPNEAPQITIESVQAPTQMDFEDALDTGVITAFSTYTTEYTNEVADEARNHNIHLMGDLLNNSIVKADGGTWSFHGTAGESNAEAGFVGAGIILDGEYTEDVGGGICQAATTVFNAVYEAGFPIPVRHNHSLYIASYPAGRDAAVNYPDLDLEWVNDSTSDVLLTTSYTDTTFTCTLYGVSPGYVVKTEVGDWEEGEKAETQEVKDPTLAPGQKVVKQKPADGRRITVIRRVYDGNGELISEDRFTSVYDAKNEIILVGPDA